MLNMYNFEAQFIENFMALNLSTLENCMALKSLNMVIIFEGPTIFQSRELSGPEILQTGHTI